MSTATFIGQDLTTQGSWVGVYGSEGYVMRGLTSGAPDFVSLPSWCPTLSRPGATGALYTAGSDPRAYQDPTNPTGARGAGAWYTTTSVLHTFGVNDSSPHRLTLYLVDYTNSRNGCTADVLDTPNADAVLDTRVISQADYRNGAHLSWTITGPVKIRITKGSGDANVTVFCVFFDPPPVTSTPARLLVPGSAGLYFA